jgi:hypothetical protein
VARLVVELAQDAFDAASGEEVVAAVTSVEFQQQGGLLSRQQKVGYVEVIGPSVAHAMGLPPGGPYIKVWLKPDADQGESSNGNAD